MNHRIQEARVLRSHVRPIALAGHIIPGALTQLSRHFGARHQQIQILEDEVFLAGAHRHLQTDIVGELLKGADLGDHHRLAEPQRPQQRARTLAHRGKAQVEHDIAGAQVADEVLDGREAQHAHAGREAHGADHRFHRELRMRFAHQNHFDVRHQAQQAAERAQRFGDALVGLEEAEDAHQRGRLIQPQLVAEAVAVGLRNPGAVRNHGRGTGKAGGAHLLLHEAAVHHHAARRRQNALRHRHAFVVRTNFQLANPFGECQRRGAAFVLALAHVGVPIAALDREVGDQVVQIAFVHHHHAGMAQRGLVDETVMAVVADVVERDIEARRVEGLRAGRKRPPAPPAA